jgi:hypothetical protein
LYWYLQKSDVREIFICRICKSWFGDQVCYKVFLCVLYFAAFSNLKGRLWLVPVSTPKKLFEAHRRIEHLLRRNTTFGVLIVLAKELLRSGEQKFGLKNTFFYTSSFSRRKFLEIYTNKEGMSEFE